MKSVLITVTVGVSTLLLGGYAYATDGVTISPSITEAKVKVRVVQPKLQDILVYVKDDKGDVVYHENIKARTTYGKTYDLSNLDDGIYTFTSQGEYVTTTKKIEVEGSSAREISKEASFQPVITLKDNYLKVNYFNKAQEDIQLSVEGSREIFHKSNGNNAFHYGKMLDISKMHTGNYFVKMKVGKKEYYHQFEKR
jgi:hypothetical protein